MGDMLAEEQVSRPSSLLEHEADADETTCLQTSNADRTDGTVM